MLPLEYIKVKLLENVDTIRVLSLFNNFDKILVVWGDNNSFNQGLHVQSNFHNFYELEAEENIQFQGMNPESAV